MSHSRSARTGPGSHRRRRPERYRLRIKVHVAPSRSLAPHAWALLPKSRDIPSDPLAYRRVDERALGSFGLRTGIF